MSDIRRGRDERARAGARRGRTDEDREYEAEEEDEERDYLDEPEEPEESEEADEAERPAAARSKGGEKLSAVEAGESGLRHITAIVTKNVEGITAVRPKDDGWSVEVELLDARHIPSSSDTLALYEVELDPAGELRSYRRTAMYSRARGREGR